MHVPFASGAAPALLIALVSSLVAGQPAHAIDSATEPAATAAASASATPPATAAAPPATPAGHGGPTPTPATNTWTVPRVSGKVIVDGHLDEEVWQQAVAIPLIYETRPGENIPASVETTVYLAYDERTVYLAFDARDPEPESIRAHLSDRDTAFDDDFVGAAFDTFNDERRAFEFFVNPFGVQMDMFMDDVNQNEDESWDAIWDSAGRVTDQGFVVEVAIPSSSLRFPSHGGVQTWGVDLLRFRPRRDRVRLAAQPQSRERNCYLCQISKLEGFAGLTPGRNLELLPTLTAHHTERRSSFPSGDFDDRDEDADPGLTVRWGITPNLIANAAINPDFSQVEADGAQLDINTQFALFFPEKRPFFLEGADFFSTGFNAVFTRNVADPDWGAKLTGKQGRHAVGAFVARDTLTNITLPGAEGSSSFSLPFSSTNAAVRYRLDVGEQSNVGLLATARQGDGYRSHLGGFDGRFQLYESGRVVFQALTSTTDDPREIDDATGRRDESRRDEAWRLTFAHASRSWNAYARYEDIGTDFRADLGFLPKTGVTIALAGGSHIWNADGDHWYSKMILGGDWDRTETQGGELLEEEVEAWWELNLAHESYAFLGGGERERSFQGQRFDEQFVNVYLEGKPHPDLYAWIEGNFGDDIDFANTTPTFKRAGNKFILGPGIRYRLGRHWQLRASYLVNRLDVAGGELFDARLTQVRLVYQFDRRMQLRIISQHTDVTRNPGLYTFAVDRSSERLENQLLFSYKLNPQTVLYLGYSDFHRGFDRPAREDEPATAIDLTQSDRTLFVKVGYAWSP